MRYNGATDRCDSSGLPLLLEGVTMDGVGKGDRESVSE